VAVAQPSIFGAMVSGGDVEGWVLDLCRSWFGTYLGEAERQAGIPAGTLARPRAYVPAQTFDKWPEDQLPALMVLSPGIAELPLKQGDGRYRARWLISVGVLCSARTQAETHALAMSYALALRLLLIQRPSLDGHAAGTVWRSETYNELDYDDQRTLGGGSVEFVVEVEDVATANAGPLTPDEPLDPDTTPWPDWPEVATADVEVEHLPHPQQLPREGGR
jgi:hypothetical protein